MAEPALRLLLPGTLCDGRLFAPLRAAWAESGGPAGKGIGCEVADLHALGHDPRAWWARLLERLPASFDVIGFSLGGVLALMLLDIAPHRVRRLVLVASNSQPGGARHQQQVDEQREAWRTLGPRALADRMVRQATPQQRLGESLRTCVQDMAEATPEAAFHAQGQLNAQRPDGLPALARWTGPLLLASGAADPWCGADKQERIRSARPDAAWHELPGAGHYLPLECPGELAHLTDSFLCRPLTEPHPTP